MTINGKKQNIRRKDFMVFAKAMGITEKAAEKMIGKIVNLQEKYIAMCRDSYMPENLKVRMEQLIVQRMERLR